ncbi:FxSxx-COOH system tetratricopeptide repeat protein, partial [Frankia sp. Ag45/Mut15]
MTVGGAASAVQGFFVSYTAVDVRWAEWAAWTLEAEGHQALIQAWDFGPGTHFMTGMQQALAEEERRLIVVLSQAYLDSVFGALEWQAALVADPTGRKRQLVVLRVEDCARPGLLKQIVSVDLFGVSAEAARERLLDAIVLSRRKPTTPPDFPGMAVRPHPESSAGAVAGSTNAAPVFPLDLPPVWNVPPRLARFVGREEQLAEIATELAARGSAAVCAVQGSGGVGKTALAVEYAHRHKGRYDVVWWVPAQDPELIAGHISALGAELGLPPEQASWPAVAAALARQRRRWLLVLDNVDDPQLTSHYHPSDPRGRLLATSRLTALDGTGAPVEVGDFSPAEAVELLAKRVAGIDATVAERIADLLGHLPLAIEQAVGYLRQSKMPPAEYATLLEGRLGDMLGRGTVAGRPGVTVANLWDLSMARLRDESPAAGELLELCAFCAPDPIPLDLITEGLTKLAGRSTEPPDDPLSRAVTDPVTWADTVSALVAYSLVRRDGPTLTVHRLIAAATRAGMDPAGQKGADVTLLDLLAAGLPANIRDPATWPRWQALLPHLRSALGTADSDRDDQALELVSSLADRIGSYLEHHGRPDTALPYHLRSLALNERILGPDHPNTLTSRHNLAYAYQTAGR